MAKSVASKGRTWQRFVKIYNRDKWLYLIIAIPIVWYLIFCYLPMYGVLLSVFDVRVFRSFAALTKGRFVGTKFFEQYLTDPYFWQLVRNTFALNIYDVIFGFPIPVIFALMLNELQSNRFKKGIQTITYLPHFISTVVICGIIRNFFSHDGLINDVIAKFGMERTNYLVQASMFRPIFVGSGIWQNFGWDSILYLAALTSVDPQLYEAARLDGAGRFQQIRYIAFPSVLPTVTIMLIMRMGKLLSEGYTKILLLYNGSTMEVADVIATYVYRQGLQGARFSYATAIGLFSSVVNLVLLVATNTISRKVSDTSLW